MTTDDLRLGAALRADFATLNGVAADTVDAPPTIVSGPPNGQPANADLVFTFSEAIHAGTGVVSFFSGPTSAVFTLPIDDPAIHIAGTTLTLHPPRPLAYTTSYTVQFDASSILDPTGHALSGVGYAFTSGLSPTALNLTGTSGNDTLQGSDLADTLSGGAGADLIIGNGGNDLIHGGDELPLTYGVGDDLYGGSGDDAVYGDGGHDHLYGDEGNDRLYGGDGNDTLDGGAGNDSLDGGAGNDWLTTTTGKDTLRGGDGDDYLIGGHEGVQDGGAGNDNLFGYAGATFTGGAGNDTLSVGMDSISSPASTIDGGAGSDTIVLTLEEDTDARVSVTGGAGSDTFRVNVGALGTTNAAARIDITDFMAGAGGDLIDLQHVLAVGNGGNPFTTGQLKLVADGANTLLEARVGASGSTYQTVLHLLNVHPDQLTSANFVGGIDPTGGTRGFIITGTAGNDTLSGMLLDDTISGLGGDDSLDGAAGNDVLDGGAGNDIVRGGGGDDTLIGGLGNDQLIDSDGKNHLDGGAGDDQLTSYPTGNNLLEGGAGNDYLSGGGDDTLSGGDGNDTISVWNDVYPLTTVHAAGVLGGAGQDTLVLHSSAQVAITASGGAGADLFHLDRTMVDGPSGSITITDFNAAEGDRLDLQSAFPQILETNPFGAAGYLKMVQSGADVELYADADGAAGIVYDFALLATLKNVDLASLSAAAFVDGLDPSGTSVGMQLTGTAGNDTLVGGWLDDTLSGGAGSDSLVGGVGRDVLHGGDETGAGQGDTLFGGRGDDTLDGGTGSDTLQGDEGNDMLLGGAGNDSLGGGSGNDTLSGGDGDDRLDDHYGANLLRGDAGNDVISSVIGPYDNYDIYYARGDATLDGGAGNDTLVAGNANDVLHGGAGDDNITVYFTGTQVYHTTVDGGDGDDIITVSRDRTSFSVAVAGTVEASGGAGHDTYRWTAYDPLDGALTITDFQAGPGGDVLDVLSLLPSTTHNPFGAGILRLVASGADTLLQADFDGNFDVLDFVTIAVLKGIQPAALTGDNFPQGIRPDGSSIGLSITGSDAADTLVGGLLDDTIHGGAGNDSLDGGRGANQLFGDDGNDTLDAGYGGNSYLDGGAGNDYLSGGSIGNDTLSGGTGNDGLSVYSGNNVVNGGDGDDFITDNGTGDNVLSGGQGNDVLTVFSGSATVDGGAGNDDIAIFFTPRDGAAHRIDAHGGGGDDVFQLNLSSTYGLDLDLDLNLDGGAGRDRIDVERPLANAKLTLTAFETGAAGDVLDLSGILPNQYSNPFANGGPLRMIQRGADAVLQFDSDGKGPGAYTDLLTFTNLDKASLTPDNFWHGFNPDGSTHGIALAGGTGDDLLIGGYLDDTLTGGAGNDTLAGEYGNDSLLGGDGDDILNGEQSYTSDPTVQHGNDTLDGGAGNDQLSSNDGNDVLIGGTGDDTISIGDNSLANTHQTVTANGDDGQDNLVVLYISNKALDIVLTGGAGSDTFTLNPGTMQTSGAITITDFQVGAGGDHLDPFQGASWNGTTPFSGGFYRILQRNADSVLQYDRDGPGGASGFVDIVTLKNVDKTTLVADNFGGYPPDGSSKGQLIDGTPDADTLVGTILDDTIRGGAGNDAIDGGRGADNIDGGDGDDTLIGGLGNDTLSGGAGNDLLTASDGIDALQGGDGDDHLIAAYNSATLDGGNGNDLLEVTNGGWDNTAQIVLRGGTGDDVFRFPSIALDGQQVSATGGAGHDTFELGSTYTVTDFQAGKDGDLIKVLTYASFANLSGNPFNDGHLRLTQSGADTLVQVHPDHSASAVTFYTVLILKNVQATSLTADNFVEGYSPPATTTPTPPSTPTQPAPPSTPAAPSAPTTPTPTPGQATTGTAGTDHLTGTAGTDHLTGTAGTDTLDGGTGNDILHGAAGNDILIGGDGLDSATYDGKAANYAITHDSAGWHVAAKTGTDGSDTLQGVERLAFADQAVALDTDGVAGQAYRLYRAAFDRTPDSAGLGFWIGGMDKGVSLVEAAQGFVASQEFIDLYGAVPTNADLVTRLYENILQRAPEQAGYDYWLDVLDTHRGTVAQVLAAFSESAENVDGTAALIGNGILFMPYGG